MSSVISKDGAQIYYKDWIDQIVPVGESAMQAAKLVRGAKLKVCPGAPHGLAATYREQFNADLPAFSRAATAKSKDGRLPPQ
jgi:hypothetical protein